MATYPRPAVIRSANEPTCASTSVAPARPANPPPTMDAMVRTSVVRTPTARAIAAPSPVARSISPARVRNSTHHAIGSAIKAK